MKIVAAAILQDGQIYTLPAPARHEDIIKDMFAKKIRYKTNNKSVEGFINEAGEFFERFSAGKIAIQAKQIEKLGSPPNLYSEDLW